jgi:hypothetical protein
MKLTSTNSGVSLSAADVAWRVLAVAVANLAFGRLLALLMGARPSLTASYLQGVIVDLATGAIYALVLLPLARRLPYRGLVRVAALFLPLYWIGYLSNLVEAWFDTTLPRGELIGGAIFLAIPILAICWLIAWLFPAAPHDAPVLGIRESLGRRSLPAWVWRVALTALLYAVLLQVFGSLYGPLIAKYYHDPAFMAQTHTVPPPDYIAWPEEFARGVLFVLSLLPVLAVVRGRDWPAIAYAAVYVTLIGVGLEAWQVIAMASDPVGFRIGEGLDLSTDALARGIIVAALLVLPAPGSENTGVEVALP